MSRSCPQAGGVRDHQSRSEGWGLVDRRYPQAVDHSLSTGRLSRLSTGGPQAEPCCAQLPGAFPQRCPLFGNPTRPLTTRSELRHRKLPQVPVGNSSEPGDAAGENSPAAVDRVWVTSGRPQEPSVVHRLHPQGRWTKNRFRPARTGLSTESTGPTTTSMSREQGIRFEVGAVHNSARAPIRADLSI